MKITLFLTTLFIHLSPLALAADSLPSDALSAVDVLGLPIASKEINEKALIISEKMISADVKDKMELKSSSNEEMDIWEAHKLREEARALGNPLSEMVKNMILIDAVTLAKNLWMLPRGVVIEKQTSITEPFTRFYDFTSLGACMLILDSLQDESHDNFSRYQVKEKLGIARDILNFSAEMFHVSTNFIQHSYFPQGYLGDKAHTVNRLASRLLKEWVEGYEPS